MISAAWAILYVGLGLALGIVFCLALDTFGKGGKKE